MDFNPTNEQLMLRDSARRFVSNEYSWDVHRALSRSELGYSADHWRSFGEFGWLGLGLPESVGGLGCSFVETAILMEELGRALVLEPYVSSAVLCAYVLDRCGNKATRLQALRQLITADCRLALAHWEPSQRYDHSLPHARATRTEAGFALNGEKSLVLDAHAADHFIVSACLEDERNYSLFLVSRTAPGLRITVYPLIDDSRAADIRLDHVFVPASALLEAPIVSSAILEEAIDRATLARSAEALGAMEAVMQVTADHLKSRVQFGQPIGKFQALQHRMAEMFIEVQEARSILYCGLANIDAAPAQRSKAIAAVKVVVANAGCVVGGSAIQLHGGMGLTAECSVGHYYKKLLAFGMIYGDVDENLDRLVGQGTAMNDADSTRC
jgi:alkylation response protein AidB-like acyl-CoA dehydrogenase